MKVAADVERAVGMEFYATVGHPCPARAKSAPEDFKVEEQIRKDGVSVVEKTGFFPLYRVEKRSIDTMHMAREMADALKSRVTYCGLKDSRAVAVQYVTPASLKSARPAEVVGARFRASLVGYLPGPIARASLVANSFRVVLRECCPDIGSRIADAFEAAARRKVPNYYGLQRFGASGTGTHVIGRAIVMRRFEDAVNLLLAGPGGGPGDLDGVRDVEAMVAKENREHPGDWLGALRAVPLGLRRLYVQAYQSFIFNLALTRALSRGMDISSYDKGDNWAGLSADGLVSSRVRGVKEPPVGDVTPLAQVVGFAYRNYGSRFDDCMEEVLREEEVRPAQFYVREMQEVSAEGGFRRPHLAISRPSWTVEGLTGSVAFILAKGQYATILLREIMKPIDPVASGLA